MDHKPLIVAITGEKRHGKSTAAKAFHEDGFHNVNFADPIRIIAKIIFGLTDDELDRDDLKEVPLTRFPFISPREVMQKIGTDLFREWIPMTWVMAAERTIIEQRLPYVVIGDLRFPDEAEWVRSNGGVVVKVYNPNKPSGTDQHISEAGQSRVIPDYTLRNDGAIDDLRLKVADLASELVNLHRGD